jgi:hypothetical protein
MHNILACHYIYQTDLFETVPNGLLDVPTVIFGGEEELFPF